MATDRTEIDPTDPYERTAQTFPVLPEAMVERMMAYGRAEMVAKGTALYTRGQRGVDFFVVLDGSIQVLDIDEHGVANIFTTHHARQFTGELDLFNNRAILVTGRTGEDSRVLRIGRADFRRMVSTEADIGEIIMRAFILRRVGLIKHAHGGATLIGSGHSGDTQRLQRFLERKRNVFCQEGQLDSGKILYDRVLSSGQMAVGHEVGSFRKGTYFEGLMIDPHHDRLMERSLDNLLSIMVFAPETTMIKGVWSKGKLRVSDGKHSGRASNQVAYGRALQRLMKGLNGL